MEWNTYIGSLPVVSIRNLAPLQPAGISLVSAPTTSKHISIDAEQRADQWNRLLSLSLSFVSLFPHDGKAHEYSADKLSARRLRLQRVTYTLVDHKWVCFADCCRIGAGPGGPLNMHRQSCVRRDTPLLLYARSIICTGADKGTGVGATLVPGSKYRRAILETGHETIPRNRCTTRK